MRANGYLRERRYLSIIVLAAALSGAAAVALIISALTPDTARSQLLPTQPASALATPALRIDGPVAHANAGLRVAPIGDLNSDGRSELAVTADDDGFPNNDEVYVVYGRANQLTSSVDLNNLGDKGFKIITRSFEDAEVAPLGDVNGDGNSDLAVAAYPGPRYYVIFGSGAMGNATIDVGALGSQGFRIFDGGTSGYYPDRRIGGAGATSANVSGSGDFNGDGLDDIVVGEQRADNNGRDNSGSAYVVFGKATSDPVDLATLGTAGIRIDGPVERMGTGAAVARLGDMNQDGLAEVLVGSGDETGPGGTEGPGTAYVVFGSTSPDNVDLASLGPRGFRVDGAAAGAGFGRTLARAGDVNGDDRDDIIVGAPSTTVSGSSAGGAAYVVFGSESTAPVNAGALGARGFYIEGLSGHGEARVGISVAGAGDANSDGLDDLIIGAPGFDIINNASVSELNSYDAGAAYIVWGKKTTETVRLMTVGGAGRRLEGLAAGDQAGADVASALDYNDDGAHDVIVGAPFANARDRVNAGSAYVVAGGFRSATVARPGYKACPPAGDTSANFAEWYLGSSFEGMSSVRVRDCVAPYRDEPWRQNLVAHLYGNPAELEAWPLQVKSYPACERSPGLFEAAPGEPLPSTSLGTIRGAPALSRDEGFWIELYTGETMVKITGADAAQVRRAAQALRVPGPTESVTAVAPLPAPANGALEGNLAC